MRNLDRHLFVLPKLLKYFHIHSMYILIENLNNLIYCYEVEVVEKRFQL